MILVDRNQPRIREMRIAVVGLRASVTGHRMVKVIMQLRHLENGEQLSGLDAIADVDLHLLHVAGHLGVQLDLGVGPELRGNGDFLEKILAVDARNRHHGYLRGRCGPRRASLPGAREQDDSQRHRRPGPPDSISACVRLLRGSCELPRGGICQRLFDAEGAPPAGSARDFERRAMRGTDRLHDRESKSGSALLA